MNHPVADKIVERLGAFTEALEKNEVVSDRFTCRRIVLNLKPTTYGPDQVKKTRKLLNASQAVFAQLLGVSVKTVSAWEQGVNSPTDMAARFMDEIQRNPEYWRGRLMEAAKVK